MLKSLLQLLATTSTIVAVTAATAPTATVDNGVFVGTATQVPDAGTVNKFVGIPFALPPQRFSAPVKPPNSRAVRNATVFGPMCIAAGFVPNPVIPGLPADSEDCLYLNVWAPASKKPAGGRAVMFWIYGGAFITGGSSIPDYDGSNLASKEDVVVVSFNYRTNLFGFPGNIPGLKDQNLGLYDQRLALDWTRRNIAAFGGDPKKITIFGESAGSASVDFLYLTTSPINPPFRAAIMESGSYYLNDNAIGVLVPQNPPPGEPVQKLSTAIGCGYDANTLACLRNKTTSELKAALDANYVPWQPTGDGITAPKDDKGDRIRRAGGGARVPTLLGTNADEGIVFTIFGTPGTWDYLFNSMFPELSPFEPQLRKAYPVGGCARAKCWSTELEAVSQVLTDYLFACPASKEAKAQAEFDVPTWRYYFNHTSPATSPPLTPYAAHSAEIVYVFGNLPAGATAQDKAISKFLMSAWARFAKNPTAGPGWKRYSGVSGRKDVQGIQGRVNGTSSVLFDGVDASVIDETCGIYKPLYAVRDPAY
ncbi:hypothetical protein HDV00_012680 [Rhizophlyctis rosea]|nr:hypothetical protein HDV00_012680 [Rhizophlyctis rosea]